VVKKPGEWGKGCRGELLEKTKNLKSSTKDGTGLERSRIVKRKKERKLSG